MKKFFDGYHIFQALSGSWEWIEEQLDEVHIKGFAGLLEVGLIAELAPD